MALTDEDLKKAKPRVFKYLCKNVLFSLPAVEIRVGQPFSLVMEVGTTTPLVFTDSIKALEEASRLVQSFKDTQRWCLMDPSLVSTFLR